MLKRIIVPVDGSTRAEQAIPIAANIARATHGTVILLQVDTDSVDVAWQYMESPLAMPEALNAHRDEIKNYLRHLVSLEALDGVATITEVADGNAAEAILAVAHTQQADVIVMSSHGRTGFKRWVLGSVAQKVARHSSAPVLILRETHPLKSTGAIDKPVGGAIEEPASFEEKPVRVMVALDGSALAEAALAPAVALSNALSAPLPGALHLVRVLPQRAKRDERITAAEAMDVSAATMYLSQVKQRLQEMEEVGREFTLSSAVIIDPDVASTLIATAKSSEGIAAVEGIPRCDVIAMATHGRSGLEHWMMGSMTERVLSATWLPLLIIRPHKGEKTHEQTAASQTQENGKHKDVEMPSWTGLL